MTLCTGETVSSSSEQWRAECEARYILSLGMAARTEQISGIARKRGTEAAARLRETCFAIEPYYLLGLPSLADRREYLSAVTARFGQRAADDLKSRALQIHNQRRATAA